MNKLLSVLFATCFVAAAAQSQKLAPELQALVDAERAFARLSVEQGVRASFIASFAEDGINFAPGPVNTRETFSKRPAQTPPFPLTLNWAPLWGTISAAGDLGISTGPSLFTDNTPQQRPPRHGLFFSVWKKQSDNTWKVIVDIGINTPAAVAPLDAPYQRIGNAKPAASKAAVNESALLAVEQEFLRAMQKDGVAKAYLSHSRADTRVHRPDRLPAAGPAAIRALLETQPATTNFETLKSGLARSGDLGWTMGKYEAGRERGHFVRAWQRDAKGSWRLLADVTNALPAETK